MSAKAFLSDPPVYNNIGSLRPNFNPITWMNETIDTIKTCSLCLGRGTKWIILPGGKRAIEQTCFECRGTRQMKGMTREEYEARRSRR